jgi:hypothetical protein
MSDTAVFIQEIDDTLRDAESSFADNAEIIRTYANDLSDQNAPTRISTAQVNIDRVLRDLTTKIDNTRAFMNESLAESDMSNDSMTARKRRLEELQGTLEEERKLAAIRKQQADELEKRNVGNFHTSWMGLLRPMKSESQVGLIIAAVGFFVLAILGFYYAYVTGLFNFETVRGVANVPDFSNIFRGGRRR